MTKILLLASVLSASLYGCSSQQTTQRSECEQIANMLEYDKCMRLANVGQDDAQRARYK